MHILKTRSSLIALLAGLLIALSIPAVAHADTQSFQGNGVDDPYEIASAEDLQRLSSLVNDYATRADYVGKSYVITDDIEFDASVSNNFTPMSATFKGEIDGQGHTIRGINVDQNSGLFSSTNGATIRNLTIADSVFSDPLNTNVSAFARTAKNTTFENCRNEASVIGAGNVGGLVGFSEGDNTFTKCSNAGTISASPAASDAAIGGLVGNSSHDAFINCFNTGTVSGGTYGGGIAGLLTVPKTPDTGSVFNFAPASAASRQGGIAGIAFDNDVAGYYHVDPLANGKYGSDSNWNLPPHQKTLEQFQNGEVAWLLNTKDGKAVNSGVWSQGASHPVFADANHAATRRVTFKTNVDTHAYTKADGTVAFPAFDDVVSWTYQDGTAASPSDAFANDTILEAVYKPPFEGDGTKASPFQIATPDQLALLSKLTREKNANYQGKHWELAADIEFEPTAVFAPIGRIGSSGPNDPSSIAFTGTFEGNGHAIKGLNIRQQDEEKGQGLFAYAKDATISNVVVQGAVIEGQYHVGGIAGYIEDTMITGCASDGNRISTIKGADSNDEAGGIVGFMARSNTVSNCLNNSVVTANGNPGGIAGFLETNGGIIVNCYNNSVDIAFHAPAANLKAGGMIGWNNAGEGNSNNFYREADSLCGARNPSSPTAEKGIAAASAEQVENGEITYLLQSANSEFVWGQKLNDSGSTTPWLYAKTAPPNPDPDPTAPSPVKVFKVSFFVDGKEYDARYTNPNGNVLSVPSVPVKRKFNGTWDIDDFSNVQANLTVNAVYTARVLTPASFAAVPNAVYDGTAQKPAIVPTDPNVAASDFTVDYRDNTQAGTAQAVITASESGTYSGSVTLAFAIDKRVIAPMAPVAVEAREYDGTTKAVVPNLAFGNLAPGDELTRNVDYETKGAYDDPEVGEAKHIAVTIALCATEKARNYTLSNDAIVGTGSIVKASPQVKTWPTASLFYGQQLKDAAVTKGESSVEGSFSWATEDAVPDGTDLKHVICFHPIDSAHYTSVSEAVGVTLRNTTPTFADLATSIPYGKTLEDAIVTGTGVNPYNNAIVSGTWKWQDETFRPTLTTSHAATFTPIADDAGKTHYDAAMVAVNVQVEAVEPVLGIDMPAMQMRGQNVTVGTSIENPHDESFTEGLPQSLDLTYQIGDGPEMPFADAFVIPEDTLPGTSVTVKAASKAVPGRYLASSQTSTLTVVDKQVVDDAQLRVSQQDLTYGMTPNPTYSCDIEPIGTPTWTVLYSPDNGATFTTDVPKGAGSYLVKAVYEDDTHQGAAQTGFAINKRDLSINVVLSKSSLKAGEELPLASLVLTGALEGDDLSLSIDPEFVGLPENSATAGTYAVRWANRAAMLRELESIEAAANYRIHVGDTASFVIHPDDKTLDTEGSGSDKGESAQPLPPYQSPESPSPQTGDTRLLPLFMMLLIASSAALLVSISRTSKTKR